MLKIIGVKVLIGKEGFTQRSGAVKEREFVLSGGGTQDCFRRVWRTESMK